MRRRAIRAHAINSLAQLCASSDGPLTPLHRYHLSLEGNDVATDLKWKLASGMVVLMPTPTTESWLMEFALQPGVHYVAVETPADVPVKLAELRARPEEAERISGAARAWMAPFADVAEEAKLQGKVLRKVVALVGGEEPRHEQHEQQARQKQAVVHGHRRRHHRRDEHRPARGKLEGGVPAAARRGAAEIDEIHVRMRNPNLHD